MMTPTVACSPNLRALYEAAEVLVAKTRPRFRDEVLRHTMCLVHASSVEVFAHVLQQGGDLVDAEIALLISDRDRLEATGVVLPADEVAVMLSADDLSVVISLPLPRTARRNAPGGSA